MENTPTFSEKWLVAIVLLLVGYAAWARGGTYIPFQAPLPWLGLAVLASPFVAPAVGPGGPAVAGVAGKAARHLLRDPIFYLGLGFLLLLVVQWANAGRALVFDSAANKWIYTAPRIPWLPSAVARAEAREMVYWFFPAWAAVLSVRSGLLCHRALRLLFSLLAAAGASLAVFGLVQYLSGTTSIYWIRPLDTEFFASFGYANHAGSYFLLVMSVSASRGIEELAKARHGKRWTSTAGFLVVFLLSLAAANLTLSRAAVLLSWFVTGFAAACLIGWSWRESTPGARVNLVAGTLGVVCLAYFVVASLGMNAVHKELITTTKPYLGEKGIWIWSFPIAVSLSLLAGFLSACGVALSRRVPRASAPAKGLVAALLLLLLCSLPVGSHGASGGDGEARDVGALVKKPREFEERWYQARAAFRIWKENPWFGVGGWGYRYFLGMNLEPSQWGWIKPGKANVHNDPLQFLAEFGAIGAGLMAATVGVLAVPIFRSGTWRRHTVLLPLLGAALVLLQSLIDLPFRCPAVLYTWLVIISALPMLSSQQGETVGQHLSNWRL